MRRKFLPAISGLRLALAETSLKILLSLALITLLGAWYLRFDWLKIVIILIVSTFLIALELINSAIEHLADTIDTNSNPSVAVIKDIAAGAVLWGALGALVIGLILLVNHLF